MKSKSIRRQKRKNKSRQRHNRKNKTRKILRGGVVMPFSETAGIFGNITHSINNLFSTVVLPPTPTYNPLLPIDPKISSQLLNNVPTQNLSENINS